MRFLLPALLLALVLGGLYLRRRVAARSEPPVPPVHRQQLARTATHVRTRTPAAQLLERVVEDLLATIPSKRPPRRYVVTARRADAVELELRLLEGRGLGALCSILVEATEEGSRTHARYEVLDILAVDGVVDRLAEVSATRARVLRSMLRLDPHAQVEDELLDLPD